MNSETDKRSYFEENYENYDEWYERHPKEFRDQVEFISSLIPAGKGVEIGVGSGRFAAALKIGKGVDISPGMVREARKRGVDAIVANAIEMPFREKEFDFSLNMVTICFLEKPLESVKEARRISRTVITVILDRRCEYVENIMSKRRGFYRFATFYTGEEVMDLYRQAGFKSVITRRKDLRTGDGQKYTLVGIIGK